MAQSPTRALLVGCGGISRAWLRAIAEMRDLQIVGMVDIVEENAVARADEFGLCDNVTISTDLVGAMDSLQPDTVLNCTVPEAHAPVSVAALEHGCHVLVEKPLADSLANARSMISAADKADRTLAVIQNRRYDPRIRRVREIIDSGAIGTLTTVNSDFYLGAHFGGFRDHMAHVLLLDMAIHTFDAARFIAAADPSGVYCKEWNPAGSWYDRHASAMAIFDMTDGVTYSYRGSWCSEGLNTTWECTWRIIGDRGTILWDGGDQLSCENVQSTGAFMSDFAPVSLPPIDPLAKSGGHAGVIREFVSCIRSDGTPETIASDNVKSLAMVFGAIESADTAQHVAIGSAS